mmetsp:Transcript_24501/g.78741  ORF Transcript_24501/g.78741 Transcript_24501/m.78741 type:complete len:231 (+) Transcript_24501:344-1036(+)
MHGAICHVSRLLRALAAAVCAGPTCRSLYHHRSDPRRGESVECSRSNPHHKAVARDGRGCADRPPAPRAPVCRHHCWRHNRLTRLCASLFPCAPAQRCSRCAAALPSRRRAGQYRGDQSRCPDAGHSAARCRCDRLFCSGGSAADPRALRTACGPRQRRQRHLPQQRPRSERCAQRSRRHGARSLPALVPRRSRRPQRLPAWPAGACTRPARRPRHAAPARGPHPAHDHR